MQCRSVGRKTKERTGTYISPGDEGTASGWHRYRHSLCESNIPEKIHCWYAKHVKVFLAHYPGQNLTEISADSVKLHLSQLSDSDSRSSWQQAQYIDAIEILLKDTAAALGYGNSMERLKGGPSYY